MKLGLRLALYKALRLLMTATDPHESAQVILDPPFTEDNEVSVSICLYSLQVEGENFIKTKQSDGFKGHKLKIGRITKLQYCKETEGLRHEFLRAQVKQSDEKYYWVVIHRVTDSPAIEETDSGRSTPSMLDVPHPCENANFSDADEQFSPVINVQPLRRIVARDRVCRDKSEDAVAILARPEKGLTAEVLLTATFPGRAPTLADLLLAAKTVTLNAPTYNRNTMCYFYGIFTFEIICQCQLWTVDTNKGKHAGRRGKWRRIGLSRNKGDWIQVVDPSNFKVDDHAAQEVQDFLSGTPKPKADAHACEPAKVPNFNTVMTHFIRARAERAEAIAKDVLEAKNVNTTLASLFHTKAQLSDAKAELDNANAENAQKDAMIAEKETKDNEEIAKYNEEIAKKDKALAAKDAEAEKLRADLAALKAAQSGSSTETSQINTPPLAAGQSIEEIAVV